MARAPQLRKRESNIERAAREVMQGLPGFPSPEALSGMPPCPFPPSGVPDHVRRTLNHLAAMDFLTGYSLVLFEWLTREGILVPIDLFKHNPFMSGHMGCKIQRKLVWATAPYRCS